MILYLTQTQNISLFSKIVITFKQSQINNKIIMFLPINKKTKKRKEKKVINKLVKYLKNNNIKDIVLDQNIMKNQDIKDILKDNNINILDGRKVIQIFGL